MIDKPHRLRTKNDFDTVFKNCTKIETPHLKIYIHINKDSQSKLGVIVSSKYASAVKRNLIRRRIKSIIRDRIINSSGNWVVILAKPNILEAKYVDLIEELKSILI